MLEEMDALDKDGTWEIVYLPKGKQKVGVSGSTPSNTNQMVPL